ncbi:MAG: hypothetical protein RMJ82_08585 [Gemmatales bacterium]|nr:hypothetical protein [Gemmatales bacterium]
MDLIRGCRHLSMHDTVEIGAPIAHAANDSIYDGFSVTNDFSSGQVGTSLNSAFSW